MKITLVIIAVFTSALSYSQVAQTSAASVGVAIEAQATATSQQELQNSNNLQAVGAQLTGALNNNQPVSAGDHVCTTYELNQQHYQDRGILNEFNQSYMDAAMNVSPVPINKTPGVNNISVIFHVVHNPNNPAENVSNALIMQVFNDLTEDYQLLNANASNARAAFGFVPADANINFCLATQDPSGSPLAEVGVVRVSTTEDWYDSGNGEENKMKASATGGSQIWDRNDYLNVWICDISNGAGSGTAGYAYRPTPTFLPTASIDGIVLDYNLGMNNENVLTHEVGHYLGLDHTWGGSGSCVSDDGFADTPNTQGPSFDFPGSCSGSQQTCGATETQYENYMDYANCTVMFTQNQADYMVSILQGIRSSLLISLGCDPTNTPPNSIFTSNPVSPAIIPVNGGVNFYDLSNNVPTGWAWTITGVEGTDWNWIGGTNAASQDPQAEFYTVGFYDVSLTASNAYGADATPAISISHVEVVAPAVGTACDTLRNWDPADAAANNYSYYNAGATNGAWGYIPGHALMDLYGDGSSMENTLQVAEQFTYAGTAEVRRIRMLPFIVEDLAPLGDSLQIRVYANDNGTDPGTILGTQNVAIGDLNDASWNEIDFVFPPSVTGTFWVGYELNYGAGQDTLMWGLTATIAGGTSGFHLEMDTYGWLNSTLLGINESIALDVMLSNGPAPSTTFTATDANVCPGGNIDVNGSGSTNVTNYYWYVTDDPFTTIIESSITPSNTFNFPIAGDFSIYLFGDGSCMTDAVVLDLTVNPPVAAVVNSTNTTCGMNNGTITVSGETGGDGTYYYSLDGANYYTSPTFTNLPDGTYTVYVATVGDQCETTYSITINPSVPFTAGVSPNTSICPGGTANISASGGVNYQWVDGVTPIAATAATNVTPPVTTQYVCLVTDGSGCQSTVFTTVTVNPLPAVPVITASGITTICAGLSVDLTSSYPTNNTWSTTETSSTITVSTAGPVTVSYTDANGCTSISAATTIVINPAPSISAGTVSGPTTCATATGSIQVTGSGTGDVSWSGTASGNANGVTLPYTIPGLAAGSYNITFTDGIGCVSNLLSQGLNDPTPPITPTITASGATTFCSGGSVTLTSSYIGGNAWSTAEMTDAITVSGSATISVTYTDGFGCSASSAPIVITMNNNPSAPTITAGGATTFCDGGSVTLTSSQGSGNDWSTTETTQSISVNSSGPYTVTYTDANGCSAISATTNITVNANPAAPTISAGGATTFCDGGSVTLTSSQVSGNVWSTTETTQIISAVISDSYTVTYTDANGCFATSTPTIVTVNALPSAPVITAGGPIALCQGEDVVLTSSEATGNDWSTTETTQSITVNSAGPYSVIYTDANGCSATSATTTITVNPLPTVSFGALADACNYDSPITLSGGTPAGGTYTGTGVTGGTFDPNAAGDGTHTITYTYTDGNGCSDVATSDIFVDGCLAIDENSKAGLKIYPNPTSNELNIELNGVFNVTISDARGRIVSAVSGTDNIVINTTNYEAGVYMISIFNENITLTERVVKQ